MVHAPEQRAELILPEFPIAVEVQERKGVPQKVVLLRGHLLLFDKMKRARQWWCQ